MPVKIGRKYILVSFDVTALYPTIPVQKALKVVLKKLKQYVTLKDISQWTPEQIVTLLKICWETHFVDFDGNICTQGNGTQIGKSISEQIVHGLVWRGIGLEV